MSFDLYNDFLCFYFCNSEYFKNVCKQTLPRNLQSILTAGIKIVTDTLKATETFSSRLRG